MLIIPSLSSSSSPSTSRSPLPLHIPNFFTGRRPSLTPPAPPDTSNTSNGSRRPSLTPSYLSKTAKILGRLTPNQSRVTLNCFQAGNSVMEQLPQEVFLVILEALEEDDHKSDGRQGRQAIVALSLVSKVFRRVVGPKLFEELYLHNERFRKDLKLTIKEKERMKDSFVTLSDDLMSYPQVIVIVIDADYVKIGKDEKDGIGLGNQLERMLKEIKRIRSSKFHTLKFIVKNVKKSFCESKYSEEFERFFDKLSTMIGNRLDTTHLEINLTVNLVLRDSCTHSCLVTLLAKNIVQHFPNLFSLRLSSCYMDEKPLRFFSDCLNLKQIHVESYGQDSRLIASGLRFPALQDLSLVFKNGCRCGCQRRVGYQFGWIVSGVGSCLTTLERLNLDMSMEDIPRPFHVSRFLQLDRLTHLELHNVLEEHPNTKIQSVLAVFRGAPINTLVFEQHLLTENHTDCWDNQVGRDGDRIGYSPTSKGTEFEQYLTFVLHVLLDYREKGKWARLQVIKLEGAIAKQCIPVETKGKLKKFSIKVV